MPAQKPSLSPPLVVVRKKRPAAAVSVTTPPRPVKAKPVQLSPPAPPSAPVSQPQPDERDGWQRRLQEKYALLDLLRDRWPQTFPADFRLVKPFAKGVHKELQKALPEVKPVVLWRTIYFYQRGGKGAYWRAILRGGPRYTLDGTPQGEVTAAEQEHAKQALAAVAAWWKARRARRPYRESPQEETPRSEAPVNSGE
jgi:hypothetical protein